ncbi:MAG: GNAT family N-acetyltransferase [Candidatus Eisenbacteria bacterium]|nr:GNAT family N-acetyltransferase [Candidatus Eisenbacteria bacterium]
MLRDRSPRRQEEPEVKYAYLRSDWGRGFATEALVGLLHHGAEDLPSSA